MLDETAPPPKLGGARGGLKELPNAASLLQR